MAAYPDYGLVRHADNPRSIYFNPDWPAGLPPHTFPPSENVMEPEGKSGFSCCGYRRTTACNYEDQKRGGKVRATPSLIVRMT